MLNFQVKIWSLGHHVFTGTGSLKRTVTQDNMLVATSYHQFISTQDQNLDLRVWECSHTWKDKASFSTLCAGSSFLPFEEVQQKWWGLVKSHDSSRCFSENTLKKMCMLSMFYCVRIHTWHAQIRKIFILKNSRPQDSEDSLQDGSASLPPSLQRAREPDLELFRAVTVSGGEVTLSMDLRLRSWPAGPCGPLLPLKRTSFIQASKLPRTSRKSATDGSQGFSTGRMMIQVCIRTLRCMCVCMLKYDNLYRTNWTNKYFIWYQTIYVLNCIKISRKKQCFQIINDTNSALFFSS